MITTITTLWLTLITTHNYFFFLEMRTCRMYSLSKFQIYNTVLLTIVTMLYITSSALIL